MAEALSLAFTPTPVGTGDSLVIEASAPVSAGKTGVPRGKYRFIQKVAAAGTSPADILAAYTAIYGSLEDKTGARIFVRARVINSSGFSGDPIYSYADVA